MTSENHSPITEMDASIIASIVVAAIRDRSLSSAYGCYLSLIKSETRGIFAPPLSDFFSSVVVEKLRLDMRRLGKNSEQLVLYSGMGDLLGPLSRLLVACNERLANEVDIISQADEKIESLSFSRQVNDAFYIRHLRNAVLHGHFSVKVDEEDPLITILYFWDARPGSNCLTAEYYLTAEDVNAVIDILIDDVCLRYLETIGWQIA